MLVPQDWKFAVPACLTTDPETGPKPVGSFVLSAQSEAGIPPGRPAFSQENFATSAAFERLDAMPAKAMMDIVVFTVSFLLDRFGLIGIR